MLSRLSLINVLRYFLVAFCVFMASRCYYLSNPELSGTIEIIPSEVVIEDIKSNGSHPTIKLADDTLINKFVSSDIDDRVLSDSPQEEVKSGNHNTGSKKPGVNASTTKEKYLFSGSPSKVTEPYIVPQLTENDRQLKIKRYLAPK
ncbi:TPA: plasmid transfer protein HtdO [Enterobacter mori]